jgi:flagellar hook-associated protein 3 FlgL
MRVTENLIFNRGTADIAAARARSEEAVGQVSSGRRVQHPGDDPAAAGQIVSRQLGVQRFEAISASVGRATDEVGTADGALDGLANVVSRAREVAVQLSNDSYGTADRAAAANEVQGLFQQAVALLNTRSGNRYVFGGNKDGAPPFDATGAYLGDTGVRQVEIAPGVLQDVSLRADVMAKGAGGGVDLLATLQSLQAALASDNAPGVRGTLDALDTGIAQVATGRAQLGTQMNVLDAAVQVSDAAAGTERKALSHAADVDAIEAATRLAQAQQALDASLTATAKSFGLTLLDKL